MATLIQRMVMGYLSKSNIMPIDMHTDCMSLWGTTQGSKTPLELNPLPGLQALRYAYEQGIQRKNIWVGTESMVVDALTKGILKDGSMSGHDAEALRGFMTGDWNPPGQLLINSSN